MSTQNFTHGHTPTDTPRPAARRRIVRAPQCLLTLTALAALAACGGGQNGQASADGATPLATAANASQPRMRIQAAASASGGGVMINEVVAGSWKGATDEDGDAEDWVELYNPATTPVDLSGYGLSNKAASPFLWTFPAGTQVAAKGYLTVWLSKKNRTAAGSPLHANFNLDSGADPVILTASNATATGIAVDSAAPPLLRADQSWCRMPSGLAGSPFMACDTPSRGAANAGNASAAILAKPVLSLASGFYAGAQTVSIAGPAGATLRYTTDGTEPTATSAVYTAPIAISTATVLRAAAFGTGATPSLVETGSYIVDAALAPRYAGLKAMMVAMSPADFAAFSANDQTREFRASFELITGGTTSVFKMDASGSAGGQLGSGDSPQRTMNIKAEDAFGAKSFPGVLWADKPGVKSVKKLRLRNGSNDWASAHLRDQLSQKMSADGPNLVSSSTSVAMFVNGRYYGLMDMREREVESLPAANLGVDKDFVDYLYDPLLGAQEIKNGGPAALAAYKAMNDYVVGTDMSVAANYAKARTLLNPESLAWDWALHMFHANNDWPHRNVHVWRSPEVDGRWTWHAHDMDFAFGRYTGVGINMNSSFGGGGSGVINSLLRNTEFRTLYLNTVADQLNIMTPAYMTTTLDGMAAEMRPYIADFYARNNLGPASNWETNLGAIRSWFGQREPIYDGHNQAQFNLQPRQPIRVAVNDLGMGSVKVNMVETQKYMTAAAPTWTGRYHPGVPVTLEAKPKPGYTFVGWQGASTSSARRITQTLAAPTQATPFPADNFSVRWSGSLEAPVSGTAQLQTVADDGIRLWFDGQLVIDNWTDQAATARNASVTLVAGRRHTLVVEYYEHGGYASASLNWQLPGATAMVPVPLERLYPQGAAATATTGSGLTGQYFANLSLSGTPAFVQNEAINVDWALNAPAPAAAPVQLTAVFAAAGAPAAPTVNAIPAQAWRTGDIVSLQVGATEPGGFDVTYAAKTLPKGLNINPATGVIYGRLTTPGKYASTITATNGVAAGTLAVTWTVTDRPGTGLLGTSPDSGTVTPPANVAPTAALTSPATGSALVQGKAVTLTATAADTDGTVAKVEFFDGATLVGTATAAPYSVSWTPASTGSHSLTARATDNAGATGTSSSVTVNVAAPPPANVPPTVALTAPTANAQATTGTTVTLSANAADSDGTIVRVDFYDGTTLIGSDTTAPYSLAWTAGSVGNHTLTAVAVDNTGASTTSTAVAVTVVAAPIVPPGTGTGLLARYYASNNLSGTPVLQRTEAVNFDWVLGAPAANVPADNFSVRWAGTVEAPVAGSYQFQTQSDDGVRVWVNGQLVIDNWTAHAVVTNTSAALTLAAGQKVSIVVEYQEFGGYATMKLLWKGPTDAGFAPVPASRLYPAATTTGNGLRGQYFGNNAFTGLPALVRDELPAMNLPGGVAPLAIFASNGWAVRWTGQFSAPQAGSYTLRVNQRADDGVRVWVSNVLVIDNWAIPAATSRTAMVTLAANTPVPVRVEFFDKVDAAQLSLDWLTPGQTTYVPVPLGAFTPQ